MLLLLKHVITAIRNNKGMTNKLGVLIVHKVKAKNSYKSSFNPVRVQKANQSRELSFYCPAPTPAW